MRLLKGKIVADKILRDLKSKIVKKKAKPELAVILVGNDKASKIYVALKERAANAIGMNFHLIQFNQNEAERTIVKEIKGLNADLLTGGIIVQLPLPSRFNTQKIINAINPRKDADGFHPENIKRFLNGKGKVVPVFPQAILKLLESSQVKLAGKKGLVIANSKVFGKMMSAALVQKKIKAKYVLSSKFKAQSEQLKEADIVITAVGKPNFLKGAMLKKGVIVIDGGIAKKGKRVLGDADFESVSKVAGFLTPVPGGVGPVTIACLLQNVTRL